MHANERNDAAQWVKGAGLPVGLMTALTAMASPTNPPTITQGIPGEGAMHPLPDAAYQPQKDATYKIVFALSKAGETPQEMSASLVRVARPDGESLCIRRGSHLAPKLCCRGEWAGYRRHAQQCAI